MFAADTQGPGHVQVQAIVDGREAVGVLMAYGISGSGKTHTIEVSEAAVAELVISHA